MLSRVADSLYWMSRNIERAENNARVISVNLISMLEDNDPDFEDGHNWKDVMHINADLESFHQYYTKCDTRSAIDFLCFSTLNPNSVFRCIQVARENASTVRDLIPSELWQLTNTLYWSIQDYNTPYWEPEKLLPLFQLVKDQSLHFQGIVNAATSRGEAYSFIRMGKYLERAEKSARVLDVFYHKSTNKNQSELTDYHHWISVLKSVCGYEPYLREHHSFIEPKNVAQFLIFNENFPRSIRFCIQQVMDTLLDLEKNQIEDYSRELYVTLGRLNAELKYMSIDDVIARGAHDFLMHVIEQCFNIGHGIKQTYYLGEIDAV